MNEMLLQKASGFEAIQGDPAYFVFRGMHPRDFWVTPNTAHVRSPMLRRSENQGMFHCFRSLSAA